MKEYSPASADVRKLIIETVRQHHPDMARVHIQAVWLDSNATQLDTIVVKVFSAIARASGAADLALVVDRASWDAIPEPDRAALVDHSLAGITVAMRDGSIATDAAGRPRLKRKRPAITINTYDEILSRYGDKAPGVLQALAIRSRLNKSRRVKVKPTASPILPADL